MSVLAEIILSMPDQVLAEMYSSWSEDRWCAGWISNGEEEFVTWLFENRGLTRNPVELPDYEKKSLKKIRELIANREEVKNVGG